MKQKIINYCKQPVSRERILQLLVNDYQISLSSVQFVLTHTTVSAHISYLYDKQLINPVFVEGEMLWTKNDKIDLLKPINIGDEIKSCILVGHNPGLTELINHFGVRLDHLPTASVAAFQFKVDSWKEIAAENAHFLWMYVPEK